MNDHLVQVHQVKDTPIYFNKQTERFEFEFDGRRGEWRSLFDATRSIELAYEQKFEGEFFIWESYAGIQKFVAKRKIYDSTEDKTYIWGLKYDEYNQAREEKVAEEDLFPYTEGNQRIQEQARKMNKEGWAQIQQSKQLKPLK